MSKGIKLFLLGASLLSAPAFPMNLGSRLGAMASRVIPRIQAAAGKAKVAAQNAKANPFPAFCKAVSAGIGAGVSVSEGVRAGQLASLDEEGIKQYEGLKDVDDKLTEFVRGGRNIPVFVDRADERAEKALRDKIRKLKNEGGLTYLSVLKKIHLNASAFMGSVIGVGPAMHTLLSSPELFVDAQEYKQFCEYVRATIQHEEGHCLEKHFYQQIAWKIAGPIAIHMAGKRMGPIAKRLLRMNPVAKSKNGMLARAIAGGIAKGTVALAGYESLRKHQEYRADDWVDDSHKKYTVEMLYYQPAYELLWRSKNPQSYCEKNLHSDRSSTHPLPAKRIVRTCGSVERGAELIVDAERQDQRRLYERRKAKMATLETEEEKIAFLVSLGYSPYVSMWEKTPEEAFKGECDSVDEKIAWCLNENDPHWIRLRNTVEQDLACAISSVS